MPCAASAARPLSRPERSAAIPEMPTRSRFPRSRMALLLIDVINPFDFDRGKAFARNYRLVVPKDCIGAKTASSRGLRLSRRQPTGRGYSWT